jgi:methyl-accepting chemotaxis protein
MKSRLSTKISILITISIVLCTSISLIFALTGMHTLSYKVAEAALRMKLESDINLAQEHLERFYGNLTYQNGQLFDKNNNPIEGRFEMVDYLKEQQGNTATIFAKKDNDFVRVVTNVLKQDGSRATGTMLGKKSSAYNNIIDGKKYIGNATILGKQFLTCYHPITDTKNEVIGILFIGIPYESVKQVITKNFNIAMFSSIMSALISLAVLLILTVFLLKRMFQPISRTTALLNDIANGEGDLTRRLDESGGDEMSELSRLFNTFTGKLQAMIKNIAAVSGSLAASSTTLKNNSHDVESHAKNMKTRSDTVTISSDQATSKVNSISASAEEMSSSVNAIATAIEQMSTSLNEVTRSCQKESDIVSSASAHADVTKKTMEDLGNVVVEVGNIIETIRTIATQTDLLALNATIEAASAGSAGKGFAVVASEVKALASQTSQATGQIRKQIETMQSTTKTAIKAIHVLTDKITEINSVSHTIVAAVEEQSSTVNEISRNISGAGQAATDIARNVSQSAADLNDISSNITKVHQSISQTTLGIDQIDNNSGSLSLLAQELNTIIGQFKV